MRVLSAIALVAILAACGRKVKVNTAPAPAETVTSIQVSNNLTQAVNVYVTSGASDILAGQVPANTTMSLIVHGVASGAMVSLKARTVDGTRTYTKDDVPFSPTLRWTVP